MDSFLYNEVLQKIRDLSKAANLVMSSFPESNDKSLEECKKILNDIFGHKNFRPLQKEVILNILSGRDTLSVMPTGSGKSICYEVSALVLKGMTLVISPLIALMKDQVSKLLKLNVRAAMLNSSLTKDEYEKNARLIKDGKIKIVYLAPETLSSRRAQEVLCSSKAEVECIAVDEAHCISSWGHNFRPDYMEIQKARSLFPKAVFLALTATATKKVQNEIIHHLGMNNPEILTGSFDRPNIFLKAEVRINLFVQVLEFLKKHRGECGIIYCSSRKRTEELSAYLRAVGINALSYHAGMSDEQRQKNQIEFQNADECVMTATIAFGMGIDKSNVRFVIHCALPKSIEEYYQEIGRAGRDGKKATALLLYAQNDINRIHFLLKKDGGNFCDEERLLKMADYALTSGCRRKMLLHYFGEYCDGSRSSCCDNCKKESRGQQKKLMHPASKERALKEAAAL